jgi:signal transduction histidine kinase
VKPIHPSRQLFKESQRLPENREKLSSLGQLSAGVAHEIRNPLTAIKLRLETLQLALAPESTEFQEVEVIKRDVDRIQRIMTEFQEFAQPHEPRREPFLAADLFREVTAEMNPILEWAQATVVEGPMTNMPLTADRVQIKRVLVNLITNAAESFSAGGTITLRAIMDMACLDGVEETGAFLLEVEDNGTGIPLDVQQKIFNPFFSTKTEGTGLGLSIAARIVERHGGLLEFRTEEGQGTTFTIILPRFSR